MSNSGGTIESMNECTFTGNTADYGGAAYAKEILYWVPNGGGAVLWSEEPVTSESNVLVGCNDTNAVQTDASFLNLTLCCNATTTTENDLCREAGWVDTALVESPLIRIVTFLGVIFKFLMG